MVPEDLWKWFASIWEAWIWRWVCGMEHDRQSDSDSLLLHGMIWVSKIWICNCQKTSTSWFNKVLLLDYITLYKFWPRLFYRWCWQSLLWFDAPFTIRIYSSKQTPRFQATQWSHASRNNSRTTKLIISSISFNFRKAFPPFPHWGIDDVRTFVSEAVSERLLLRVVPLQKQLFLLWRRKFAH